MKSKMPLSSLVLVANTDKIKNHAKQLESLFTNAKHLDCLVAFASYSGFRTVLDTLKKRLKSKDFSARFLIGLDFYHTDPDLLEELYNMSLKGEYKSRLGLFINGKKSKEIFHPKAYVFHNSDGTASRLSS